MLNKVIIVVCVLFFVACKDNNKVIVEAPENKITTSTLKALDIPDLKNDLDDQEIKNQERLNNKISFDQAFFNAITSFLTDDKDINSPLSISADQIDVGEDEGVLNHRTALAKMINNSGHLCLVSLTPNSTCEAPQNGAKVEDNWIFQLKIDDLKDRLFWAVVPRNGSDPAYNYGSK